MNFRTKNDINYFKFLELSEKINENDDVQFINYETARIFKTKKVGKFAMALERKFKIKRRFKINFKLNAGQWIDADTYKTDGDNLEFLKVILKPRFFWNKVEQLSLAEAELVISNWVEFSSEIKSRYEWIYNPPVRVGTGVNSQGSIERQAFVEHYGAYMEMIYLLCNGNFTKFEEITNWELERFLFQAEYLLRKRDVENIK